MCIGIFAMIQKQAANRNQALLLLVVHQGEATTEIGLHNDSSVWQDEQENRKTNIQKSRKYPERLHLNMHQIFASRRKRIRFRLFCVSVASKYIDIVFA
jgi:hypothetical protein